MKCTYIGQANGLSTLVRPKFGPGMLLQHDDLELLNVHTRELSRLLFRSFFGCGVVCGLKVAASWDECGGIEIQVEPGVALTSGGDPVYVPDPTKVLIYKECLKLLKPPRDSKEKILWVSLCPKVKCCVPRAAMCDADDDETTSAYTKVRDAFEIRVEGNSPGHCHCEPMKTLKKSADSDDKPADKVEHCFCADPGLDCHKNHYDGVCSEGRGCECDSACGCNCIVLAKIDIAANSKDLKPDHTVRRFIRPVLMSDPERRGKASNNGDDSHSGPETEAAAEVENAPKPPKAEASKPKPKGPKS